MSEQVQIFTPGRGIGQDGAITSATAERGLLTSQLVQASPADIAMVDFSGKHHFSQEPPIGGATESVGMFRVALEDDMPTLGIRIGLDIEADDTATNYLVGLREGYLDPELDTIVPIHRDHWPRVKLLGALAMPDTTLRQSS
jgi:hypothetical protein